MSAQQQELVLRDYRPRSRLVVKASHYLQPRYPVIDAHNHLCEPFGGGWDSRPLSELLELLDQAGVHTLIDLDGGWGEAILNLHLDYFKTGAPDRFQIFGGVDWSAWPEQGDRFAAWAATRLKMQAARGAQGLKIWKGFGLQVRDQVVSE